MFWISTAFWSSFFVVRLPWIYICICLWIWHFYQYWKAWWESFSVTFYPWARIYYVWPRPQAWPGLHKSAGCLSTESIDWSSVPSVAERVWWHCVVASPLAHHDLNIGNIIGFFQNRPVLLPIIFHNFPHLFAQLLSTLLSVYHKTQLIGLGLLTRSQFC